MSVLYNTITWDIERFGGKPLSATNKQETDNKHNKDDTYIVIKNTTLLHFKNTIFPIRVSNYLFLSTIGVLSITTHVNARLRAHKHTLWYVNINSYSKVGNTNIYVVAHNCEREQYKTQK